MTIFSAIQPGRLPEYSSFCTGNLRHQSSIPTVGGMKIPRFEYQRVPVYPAPKNWNFVQRVENFSEKKDPPATKNQRTGKSPNYYAQEELLPQTVNP